MRRYGTWAGAPKGVSEDVKRCIAEVAHGYLFYQCSRKRGHGPDGLYCKQHAKQCESGLFPYSPPNKPEAKNE